MTGFWTLVQREVYRFVRVWTQTVLPPVINAVLYIVVFGQFIGSRIGDVGGTSYTEFLIPGLIMMNIILTSYGGTSFSIFFAKWERYIDDLLTSPLSYLKIVGASLLGGGLLRALFVGSIITIVLALFGGITIVNPLIALYFLVMVSLAFGAFGLMTGLWAERFDHFTIIQTFLITPLIYLGGVFYSIETLPATFQTLSKFNPMLYMINGFRYGMTGASDTALWVNMVVVGGLAVVLVAVCVRLFSTGYKLRD